jgi:hypothetical protein
MAQPGDKRFSGEANWPTLWKSALNPFEANRGFLAKISQAGRRSLRCARQVPDRYKCFRGGLSVGGQPPQRELGVTRAPQVDLIGNFQRSVRNRSSRQLFSPAWEIRVWGLN